MRTLVISADYPGPDLVYGDTFVHARVKKYLSFSEVIVLGYNRDLAKDRIFKYEGIDVYITNDLKVFSDNIKRYNPDIIAIHLLQHFLIPLLSSFQKPLIVFIHGYEALSWKRRLMNYRTPGDLKYLWSFVRSNRKQLKAMKQLASGTGKESNVQFVFVSNWLKKSVETDWNMSLSNNSQVIANGIDTALFHYKKRNPELRKKILLLRSFKARNYANDIAIEAILLLSTKSFFNELEFSIFGEGYLFTRLTKRIGHLPNVHLNNYFVENKDIPRIHTTHGIFLCPSRLDTQGVSMCEAMSSGLVPITSPVGGIPEYSTNNISGFQVGTPQEIADKIEYLFHHPDVFLKMSEQASLEVEQKCELSNTVSREIELFQSVVKKDGHSNSHYQQCIRCVLDSHDDAEISFDQNGICSYCRTYDDQASKFVKKGQAGEDELRNIITKIKASGHGKPYDCILGISGGVDSTYLALKAKELGLRPLAVHFDNGWNSELAVNNIENIINKLGFDLHTFVVDWEEFRDLQIAFLKASVVDIELITDHAIITKLYQLAIQYKIKYILSGSNIVTESILPAPWIHDKRDHLHIRAISNLFGSKFPKTFPLFNSTLKWKVEWLGIKSVSLLNLMPYNVDRVKTEIANQLNWRDYGGKHYESVFTRFYQGYILPNKFKIDKRRAHVSNLICSGQITREEALIELQRPAYDVQALKSDYDFVLKKLELSENAFADIMKAPVKKHTDYPIEQSIYSRFPVLKIIRPFWIKIKSVRDLPW